MTFIINLSTIVLYMGNKEDRKFLKKLCTKYKVSVLTDCQGDVASSKDIYSEEDLRDENIYECNKPVTPAVLDDILGLSCFYVALKLDYDAFRQVLLSIGKEDKNETNETNTQSKEEKTMGNVTDTFKTVMSMKMLSGIMKNGEQDLGKLFLMQQMMNGEPLKVTDVIKSKLIKQFDLDKEGDLPIEKVMLLQMLDGGEVDLSQLLTFKMMGSLFDEEKK